jgi:deoxyadenosine/deoxycytidine kinase
MSKLITIVGNSGVGKTTFTLELCRAGSFSPWLEKNINRPFQEQFSQDLHRFALANQIDFLLFRAGHELAIRQGTTIGVLDGGLDQDFNAFTRLFYNRGYLTDGEFQLCERLYRFCRVFLPPPDLIIRLVAPLEVIIERYSRRRRELDIAQINDLKELENLIEDWLSTVTESPILTVDASLDDPGYARALQEVLAVIKRI